jgi:nucleotide-binding universal stress UspA family protein
LSSAHESPSAQGVERWESDDDAQKLVDAAVAVLHGAGVDASGQVLPGQGRIGEKILEAANAIGADLIVLGSRDVSRVEDLMIGSISHKIITSPNARCCSPLIHLAAAIPCKP